MEDKMQEIHDLMDEMINKLNEIRKPEFKDGDPVWVKLTESSHWEARIFKDYFDGQYRVYSYQGCSGYWYKYCKPFK